jgi:pimeloyl-ACP methyl ester carboxylesterase
MGDYSLPIEQAASITTPTLVIAGGATWDWMRDTAKALADALPNGEYRLLEGQAHDVSAEALAPVLVEFFNA